MDSTYTELEKASTDEIKEMHGRLFQRIKRLQRERNYVLEELETRYGADGESVDADVLR